MSDSAKNIKSVVPSTKRCFTTRKALLEKLKNVLNAVEGAEKDRNTVVEGGKEGENPVIEVEEERLLAEGGYNYVWLVSFTTTEDKVCSCPPTISCVLAYILRNLLCGLTSQHLLLSLGPISAH